MSKSLYVEAIQRVERLHRRLLDIVAEEFARLQWDDINPAQALMLHSLQREKLTPAQIQTRLALTNSTYNTKKLVQGKYLVEHRSKEDRRTVRFSLTPKGEEVAEVVDELLERHLKLPGMALDDFGNVNVQMARLERFWADLASYIGVAA